MVGTRAPQQQQQQPAFHLPGGPDEKLAPVHELLVDPITRKKYQMEFPYDDKILRLNAFGKFRQNLKNIFVTMPTTLYQGLRGDTRFTFSDFLNIANIPYYLGGAVLALGFAAGGDRLNMARQGVGVGLYYLGTTAVNKAINTFYKQKTGVDLDLRFKRSNGDIEKVYASADFPRLDVLEDSDYRVMTRKMRIPDNIADPKREVNDQARVIVSASRADKLILGNLLAATGAGYLARSDAWGRLLGVPKNLAQIWSPKDTAGGGFPDRMRRTANAFGSSVTPALKEMIMGHPGERSPWMRKGLIGGMVGLSGLTLAHSWMAATKNRSRAYESPFMSNLSPALSPELSPATAALQKRLPGGSISILPRQGVFDVMEQIERTENADSAGGLNPS